MLSFILLLGIWVAQGITSNTFLEDQTLEPASDIPERMEDDPSPSILTQAFTQVYFTPDGVGDDYYIVETTDPYSLSSTWGKKINAKDGYYMCSLEVQYSDYIKNTDNSFINGLRIWYCPFASTKGEHYYVNHFRMSEDYLTYPISCRGVNAIYPICGFYWRVNKEDYKTADKVGIIWILASIAKVVLNLGFIK